MEKREILALVVALVIILGIGGLLLYNIWLGLTVLKWIAIIAAVYYGFIKGFRSSYNKTKNKSKNRK